MRDMQRVIREQLMKLLDSKKLNQITVTELSAACNVSRQTFYYYYQDVYDVLEDIFSLESKALLNGFDSLQNWKFGFEEILRWMLAHRKLVMNSFTGGRNGHEEKFVGNVLRPFLQNIMNQAAEGYRITEEQKEFMLRVYVLIAAGLTVSWIEDGMREDPSELTRKTQVMLHGHMTDSIRNFDKENRK